ncbi:hypothetical protein FACS1894195_3520 [Bacteroidia bacterium]|nr:hypothetical protein FACS1894195_3450 [Bacteroidia bacterium]GHV62054.1 hypothetical protein FACS1894195_3520 [Bacteroidia bacterium]
MWVAAWHNTVLALGILGTVAAGEAVAAAATEYESGRNNVGVPDLLLNKDFCTADMKDKDFALYRIAGYFS